jgi:hypothetical protein
MKSAGIRFWNEGLIANPSPNSDARQIWFAAASSRAWASVSASTITATSRCVKESSHSAVTSSCYAMCPRLKGRNSGACLPSVSNPMACTLH